MFSSRSSLAILLLLLAWLPLPFASQRPWALLLFSALAALCLIFALFSSVERDFKRLYRCRLPVVLLGILPIACLISLIPFPFLDTVIGREMISYSPYDTFKAFFRYSAICIVFIATILIVCRRKYLFAVLLTIVVCGVFQALYGSYMTLSGIEYGFFTPKYAGTGNATGTFVNANHFAGFLIVCISVAMGLVLAGRGRGRLISVHSLTEPLMLVRVSLAFLVLGVLLSSSKTANLLLVVCATFLVLFKIYLNPRSKTRFLLFLTTFFVLDILVVGYWFGFKELADQVVATQYQEDNRWSVYMTLLNVMWSHILLGIGPGAFDIWFVGYNPSETPLRFVHAHNDYLQLALEFGLFPFLALMVFFALTFKRAFHLAKHSGSWRVSALALGAMSTLLWLSLHSLVDFNFQIMTNATFVVVISALVWSASHFDETRGVNVCPS